MSLRPLGRPLAAGEALVQIAARDMDAAAMLRLAADVPADLGR